MDEAWACVGNARTACTLHVLQRETARVQLELEYLASLITRSDPTFMVSNFSLGKNSAPTEITEIQCISLILVFISAIRVKFSIKLIKKFKKLKKMNIFCSICITENI
jgi:hypothetical protein